MAKVHKVVGPQQSETLQSSTDWNKCFLCQENTKDALSCPAKSTQPTAGAIYKTIADNLVGFHKINSLPKTIQISRLDDGDGLEETLRKHKASYHNSCRLQYNKSKLQRAEKRKSCCAEDDIVSRKYTRKSTETATSSITTCFFCGESQSGGSLRAASTFDLDLRVRQCARKLNDMPLLAKLSAGDLIAQEAKYHSKCLAALYNRARDTKTTHELDSDAINHGIAFAGLVSTTGLAPCNHEEADTRMMLHVEDAVKQGYNKVMVRTVDTDVVVLAVNTAQRLNICELWVAFGTGKHFRFIPSHAVARKLGPDRSMALPMFHAFTGCDNVSFFSGVGKRTAWATWKAFEEITPAFCALSATPESMEEWLHVLERFVVLLYDRNSSEMSINQARKQLFTQKNRTVDHIPPTKAALLQHCKRAIYQAGHCWGQLMVATPELPSPSEWGWTKSVSGGWDMFWTSLPEASEACRQLIRCACKKGCRGQCKCIKEARKCTLLCACGGECTAN